MFSSPHVRSVTSLSMVMSSAVLPRTIQQGTRQRSVRVPFRQKLHTPAQKIRHLGNCMCKQVVRHIYEKKRDSVLLQQRATRTTNISFRYDKRRPKAGNRLCIGARQQVKLLHFGKLVFWTKHLLSDASTYTLHVVAPSSKLCCESTKTWARLTHLVGRHWMLLLSQRALHVDAPDVEKGRKRGARLK